MLFYRMVWRVVCILVYFCIIMLEFNSKGKMPLHMNKNELIIF